MAESSLKCTRLAHLAGVGQRGGAFFWSLRFCSSFPTGAGVFCFVPWVSHSSRHARSLLAVWQAFGPHAEVMHLSGLNGPRMCKPVRLPRDCLCLPSLVWGHIGVVVTSKLTKGVNEGQLVQHPCAWCLGGQSLGSSRQKQCNAFAYGPASSRTKTRREKASCIAAIFGDPLPSCSEIGMGVPLHASMCETT